MKAFTAAATALAGAALFLKSVCADVDPIVIKVGALQLSTDLHESTHSNTLRIQGSKFFYETNGTQL
jgi:hypothetical protein